MMNKIDLLSLPNDMLIEILAYLSASSHSDILRAKSICKIFNELGEDNFVYKRMCLKDIETVPWQKSREQTLLLNRCSNCHNSEALYIQGVVDYFSKGGSPIGFEYLQKAANLGHTKAVYVIGIISLLGDVESNKRGIQILNRDILKGILWKCRGELVVILRKLWMNIPMEMINNGTVTCCEIHHHSQKKWRFTWPVHDADDDMDCRACKCDRELDYLMPYFRINR